MANAKNEDRERVAAWIMEHGYATGHGDTIEDLLGELSPQITEHISRLEKLVYVPGQWRCAKCNCRLSQMNLYAADGSVGTRDEPGDKCPNCNGPLWRVSAMDDRNEAFKTANDMFDRNAALLDALRAVKHGAEYPDELGDIIDAAIAKATS